MARFERLPEVLFWKYGPVADCQGNAEGEWAIVRWRHPSIPQPSNAQLILDVQEYEQYEASILYQKKRQAEYPPIGDQLDAIWKLLEKALIGQSELPSDAIATFDQVRGVKEKYPAPQEKV